MNIKLRQWSLNQNLSECSSCQVVVLRRSCIVFHIFLHTRGIVRMCVCVVEAFIWGVSSGIVRGLRYEGFSRVSWNRIAKTVDKVLRVRPPVFFLSVTSAWLVVSRLSPLTAWRLPTVILSTSPLAWSQWAIRSTSGTKPYQWFCLRPCMPLWSMASRRVWIKYKLRILWAQQE